MKINLNPIEFLKNRGEQSALKSVIEKKLKDFEYNLSYAKIDWKKRPQELFIKMKSDELIALTQAVNVLNDYAGDIKKEFNLSEDVRKTLDEIEKLTKSISEIANLDTMKKTFKDRGMDRWDEKKEGPYVIEPMASQLQSEMHHLWVQIHKLKSADFDSILSGKLKIDPKY